MLGNFNFDTFFANKLLTNCNIKVVANEWGELFGKEHIAGFTMSRENECALSFAPNDTVVIDIINWNTLSEDAKYWLSKPTSYDFQNFVWLMFFVNGESTTYGVCLAVEKIEINTKKWRAKLTLCSPFRTQTSLINYFGYNDFDTFPVSATVFEAYQNIAVNTGKGMIIPNYQDYYWDDHTFVDINRSDVDVMFNELNITSDIVESEDENDRSNIEFVGIKPKTADTLFTETKAPEWDFWHEHLELSFFFDFDGKQYVASSITVTITHAGSDVTNLFDIFKYNDHILVKNKSGASLSQVNYVLDIKGYEAELDEPTSQNYVKSYTWVTGSQSLADAQAKTREYYSHKKYIEFDCRLDPRIEPLDNIYVEDVGVIKVEKVSMRFNGAFNGHIKGRLIADTLTISKPVVNISSYNPNSYSFTITNNNPFPAQVRIYYSGTSPIIMDIGAKSTITCNNSTCPLLHSSFEAYDNRDLMDYVTCRFDSSYGISDGTVILEANY